MGTGKDGPGTILPQFLEWAMVSFNVICEKISEEPMSGHREQQKLSFQVYCLTTSDLRSAFVEAI
jgi:hypothetical protein